MPSNLFEDVIALEEKFYDTGFQQGLDDGSKAGRIEGRLFGLEKGFEKYVESGRLYGRAIIWGNRIATNTIVSESESTKTTSENLQIALEAESKKPQVSRLPPFPSNARLVKHVQVLHALAESESLSTENTEEAVSDFDDRLKRAQAKAKIIERMVGEARGDGDDLTIRGVSSKDGSIEDNSVLTARH